LKSSSAFGGSSGQNRDHHTLHSRDNKSKQKGDEKITREEKVPENTQAQKELICDQCEA
jgi:hypothetical protein